MFYRKVVGYQSIKVIFCVMLSLFVSAIFATQCFATDQNVSTGLVIDAKGIGLKTSISPKIMGENGAEL